MIFRSFHQGKGQQQIFFGLVTDNHTKKCQIYINLAFFSNEKYSFRIYFLAMHQY